MNTGKFILKLNPTLKQKACWEKLLDNTTEFILFGGGAGGGKSWVGCEWLVVLCLSYPGVKLFVGRNELKRIMQSTYITFQKVCKWHKIPRDSWKFNAQYSYVEFWNGSRIDFIDLKQVFALCPTLFRLAQDLTMYYLLYMLLKFMQE